MVNKGRDEQNRELDGRLLVFGDSHSVIWEGNNVLKRQAFSRFSNVEVFHLGPALAYNLLSESGDGLGKWGSQAIEIITRVIENESHNVVAIMLVFGEIDIRTQIVKRAFSSKQSIESAVERVICRLHGFAAIIYLKFRIKVLIWEPVATSGAKNFLYNPTFPAVGTEVERNYATHVFAIKSREYADASRGKGAEVFSFGIANKLMNFYETRPEFFEDGCHLNQRGLTLAVEALKQLCLSEKSLPPLFALFDNPRAVSSEIQIRDVAGSAKLTMSSAYATPNVLHKTNRGWCFHTNKEINPYVLIDIGYASLVREIKLFNRFDACKERCSPLHIFVGLEPKNLKCIARIEQRWGNDNLPIPIEIDEDIGPVRFLLFRLMAEEYFHLGEVQILEASYLL
jgi:hypothetical protein